MIKEKIEIAIYNSYKIENWEKAIIKRCVEDNPSSTMKEISELLDISERTLDRKCTRYGIQIGWSKLPGPESFINNSSRKQK